jgi:hypothetical protein
VSRGNVVQHCIDIDKNLDDGFQSGSRKSGKGVVRDVTVTGNRFIEWNRPEDHPLRGRLQGIGLFDGIYENWRIENNLVIVRQGNGITVLGGRNTRVVNNTVVNPEPGNGKAPFIRIGKHKDGRLPEGNAVVNNIAMTFMLAPGTRAGHNLEAKYRGLIFKADDVTPQRTGPAFGASDPAWQPAHDLNGRPRPTAGGDLGALESTP